MGAAPELVRPGDALFEMLASLRIVEEGAVNTKQMILDVIKDAVLLLAGEAAASGRRSRSKASSYRLSDIGDSLDKAFRVRRDGEVVPSPFPSPFLSRISAFFVVFVFFFFFFARRKVGAQLKVVTHTRLDACARGGLERAERRKTKQV